MDGDQGVGIAGKIVGLNLLAALMLASVVAFLAYRDRQEVIDHAFRDAENLANALAEQTNQTLAALDIGLVTAAERIRDLGAVDETLAEVIHYHLVVRQETSTATFGYFVLDAAGRAVASSRAPDIERTDFSDLPEYRVHLRNGYTGLFLGPPRTGTVGTAEGRRIINATRRIDAPDGSFGGIAAAALSLDYMLDFYDVLRVGEEGVVGLFTADGKQIVRSPLIESQVGRDFSNSILFTTLLPDSGRGTFIAPYVADGRERISAYRQLDDGGPVVFVGLEKNEALAAWRDRLWLKIGFAGAIMALFVGVSIANETHIRRRRNWEEQRSARLRLLAEESADLVRETTMEGLLHRVAQAGRKLIGVHQAVASSKHGRRTPQAIHEVSLSEKYAAWRNYVAKPDGGGIYRLVHESIKPMMLTQAELESHPAWRGFGAEKDRHPPMNGWLGVPVIGQDGRNIGLIQFSDKESGSFGPDDLNEAMQLANITAVALENLMSIQRRDEALDAEKAAREEIETIFASIADAVWAVDTDWCFVRLNAEAERMLGRSSESLMGVSVWDAFPELAKTALYTQFHQARRDGAAVVFDYHYRPLDTWYAVRAFPHKDGLTVYFQDETRRVQAEDQLRQAQKMEAIGQLTGGIAHDFNNLLTVILGSADTLQADIAGGDQAADQQRRSQIDAVIKAAERAAGLTHRLLAFARRQPLDPRPTAVDTLVSGMATILTRTLGETIEIEVVRDAGLWLAEVDPGELESAVLNLAINARDAMPNGGKLTIETQNVAMGADYAKDHGIERGHYVVLAVSDTGTGMSAETVERAFDPFFTTKERGKGSGLGLSMVYGFARQSGGNVKIYSEPGEGTTVRIYLPRSDAFVQDSEPSASETAIPGGRESILLVEDDDLVREHTLSTLETLGYTVTACATGTEALATLAGGRYDLLLTDVVLAGHLSGKQVADAALDRNPDQKILFMSGYTENAIVHHGRLDRGVTLLGKPFRLADIARKVRDVLDK